MSVKTLKLLPFPFYYTMKKYSEIEKVEAILGHSPSDKEALEQLYKENFGIVKSYILKNHGDYDEANDVFQDGMIILYNNIRSGKFRAESTLSTYLFSICRFLWLKKLQSKGKKLEHEEVLFREITIDDSDSQVRNIELEKLLSELFLELGSTCAEILRMSYFDNLSMNEISVLTGYKDEQNARNKKHKCLVKLRDLINASPKLANELKMLRQ
jgi:RNA polymerase sigma factor (sigma-70 family)